MASCGNCNHSTGTKSCARCINISYCSKKCQISHWKVHKWTCSGNIEIRSTTIGNGLFAKKRFEVGDVIINETPIITLPAEGNPFQFNQKLSTLNKAQQSIFSQLSNNFENEKKIGIFKTNAIPHGQTTNGKSVDYCSIFPLISRANHSCNANARYIWRPNISKERLVAQRVINIDDEITVSYIDDIIPRDQRRISIRAGRGRLGRGR